MASREEALILAMNADLKRIENAMNRMVSTTNRQLSAVEGRFDKMNAHVKRAGDQMAQDLRASIAAIGIGYAIGEVVQYGDSWTAAGNKLAAAGVANSKLAGTMDDLVALAQETRSEFSATVDLYAGLTRATEKLGLSQQQVRQITETTLKAFVAGGAAASEQASGILQLKQALGSGVLQGDELRSLRENAPVLAQAIANEFGVSIAQLKKLGEQGVLTSDRVAKAILNAKGVNDQFARTNQTVAQSITNLQTAFTQYIGKSAAASAGTQALAGFLKLVTDNFKLFADAAAVAALVLGGALAAGAVLRLGTALVGLISTVRTATTVMAALRAAMVFFTGPIGAVILAIGAAMVAFGIGAAAASTSVDDLKATLTAHGDVTNKLKEDTDALAEANRKLNEAITAGGEAARNAAVLEIAAIEKRLSANEAMRKVYLAQSQAQLANLERDGGKLEDGRSFRDVVNSVTDRMRRNPDFRDISVNGEFSTQNWRLIAEDRLLKKADNLRSQGQVLGQKDSDLLNDLALLKKQALAVAELRANVEALQGTFKQSAGGLPALLAAPSGEGAAAGSAAATTGLAGYATEAEKLTAVLKALTEAREKDLEVQSIARFNLSTTLLSANTAGTGQAAKDQLDGARQALIDANKALSDNDGPRSRTAVAALLDYAKASGDVAGALAKIPKLSEVLSPRDVALVTQELHKLAEEGTAAVATGYEKLALEHAAALKKIDQAEANDPERIRNHELYLNARLQADKEYAEARAKLWDETFHRDVGPRNLSAAELERVRAERASIRTPAEIAAAKAAVARQQGFKESVAGYDRDAEVARRASEIEARGWSPDDAQQMAEDMVAATERFRDSMRDAVKSAFREGIETGDWGDAFKSIIASALSNALDGGLNNIADGITNWLTGKRAAGGPVGAGGTYLVGENGPELLRMGAQSGHVFNAAQMSRAVGGAGYGATASIYAPLIVNGSIDSVTWPKVEQALKVRDAVWAKRMGGGIDARVADSSRRGRIG